MSLMNVVKSAGETYDFVRFTFTDVHGIGRSKTIPKAAYEGAFSNGIGVYNGGIGMALNGDATPYLSVYESLGPEMAAAASGNMTAVPDISTLHPLPTSGNKEYKVGQVLCETYSEQGELQQHCPRVLARQQLERLESLGFHLYAAVELEFVLVKEGTLDPVFAHTGALLVNLVTTMFEPVLLEIVATLAQMGIDVETVHTESGCGEFELALKPLTGIQIADRTFLAKDCVKEVAKKHGYSAIFMSRFSEEYNYNTAHFNHSLINADSGNNALLDLSRSDKLSDTFRNWMGGLTKHFAAQFALCSPTVNCYRRKGARYVQAVGDWGIDDRIAGFRVKVPKTNLPYIESRNPSGSSNVYLVLASIVCSGIDGLKMQTECPLPRIEKMIPVACRDKYIRTKPVEPPTNLSAALEALELDAVFKETLGDVLIKWFTALKRNEILEYEKCSPDKREKLDWEREQYLFLL